MNAGALRYDDEDPGFRVDLEDSWRTIRVVARWLEGEFGLQTQQQEERVRSLAEHEQTPDEDLWVERAPGLWHLWEVKRRYEVTFGSRESYPYDDCFVTNVHNWTHAKRRPDWYCILSGDRLGCLIAPQRSRPKWVERKVWVQRQGRHRRVFACPVELMQYAPIPGRYLAEA